MNVIQCKSCKKLFQSLGERVCDKCHRQLDDDFVKVRDYIYENENSTIDNVAEDTGVSKKTIMQLLEEGRLVLAGPGGVGVLFCTACKKPIPSGKMCKECEDDVKDAMRSKISSAEEPEPEPKSKGKSGNDPSRKKINR